MKIRKDKVTVIPMGGCDEIGMNMTLYHYNNHWIMVDCGIGFLEPSEAPGVDIAVPDLHFLAQNKIKVSALIITHAHEDHIGGVCYLWNYLQCTVYASVFAANVLRVKAGSVGIEKDIKIIDILPTKPFFNSGPFYIEMVGLTHSVVEMNGLFMSVAGKTIFHTGDWKLDDDPVVGEKSQIDKLKEIGNKGLDVLFCDSTNVFNQHRTKSEGSLQKPLLDIVKSKRGRVVISVFSSNIARIKTIAEIAKKTKRRLVVTGTALHRTIAVACKSGYIADVEYEDMKNARDIPKGELLLIATGCQGEKLASISKLASNSHPLLKLSAGDTVILSSKMIPVNFMRISKMVNKFIRHDIEIITEKNANVHVSGHPSAPELKEMYSFLKPRTAVPVHGEPLHLKEQCRLAKEEFGVNNVILSADGDVLEIGDEVKVVAKVPSDYLGVDGYVLRPMDSNVMKERRKMTHAGVALCSLILNANGTLVCNPTIICPGLLDDIEDKKVIKDCVDAVIKIIKRNSHNIDSKKKLHQQNLIGTISQRISQVISNDVGKAPLVRVCLKVV